MGSYFADKWAGLLALPGAIADAPVFFAIVFAVGGVLIWLKWRMIGSSQRRAIDGVTHGHRAAADSKKVRHETGIGTRDILIMRKAPLGGMIWFALLFFGGGAAFYLLVVLQSGDATSEDWWVFAGLSGFTIGAMALIENNQTRILVDRDSLQKRRILRRRQTIRLADISTVQPLGSGYTRGVIVQPTSGKPMRIPAAFSGYRDLLRSLAPRDPKLSFAARALANEQGAAHA